MTERKPIIQVLLRWWGLVILVTLIASLLLSLMACKLGWVEQEYESVALVEVRPLVEIDSTMGNGRGNGIHRQFMNSAFEPSNPFVSPSTLEHLLEDENLTRRLGGDPKVVLRQIKAMLSVDDYRDTDLIEVRAQHTDALLARDLVEAVCQAYRERRIELAMAMRKGQLKAIWVELQNKVDRVAELTRRWEDITSNMEQMPKGNVQVERFRAELKVSQQELVNATKIRDSMQKRYEIESTKMAADPIVLIMHQMPEVATSQASYTPQIMAALMSLPVSLLIAVLFAYLAEALFPVKEAVKKRFQPDY